MASQLNPEAEYRWPADADVRADLGDALRRAHAAVDAAYAASARPARRGAVARAGSGLAGLRADLRVSIAALSDASGLSAGFIRDVEAGRSRLGAASLGRLARALDLRPSELAAALRRVPPPPEGAAAPPGPSHGRRQS